MSGSHRALPETQLEVDLLILDYLLFMGTRALLQEQVILREEGVHENLSQQPLRMVDSFISMFKANHPGVRTTDEIRFRLKLVKFTTLYSKRNVPCEVTPPPAELDKLRRKHRKRAEEFYDSSSDSSFQDSLFEQQMGNSARRQAIHRDSTSLADLVPLFIGVSAMRASLLNAQVHESWMELAGEFMLQAALEQCLEYSESSGTKLREVFSWGWRPTPTKYWDDEEAVNDMFCDAETKREVDAWAGVRRKYMDLLKPKSNTDLAKQLKALTRRFPLDRFEESMLHFLEAMQLSLEDPLLVQLDKGTIEGMSEDEVQELKRRIRLPC